MATGYELGQLCTAAGHDEVLCVVVSVHAVTLAFDAGEASPLVC